MVNGRGPGRTSESRPGPMQPMGTLGWLASSTGWKQSARPSITLWGRSVTANWDHASIALISGVWSPVVRLGRRREGRQQLQCDPLAAKVSTWNLAK